MATPYSLAHLSDDVLLLNLTASVARENSATAWVVAHIAEVERRRLYAPAGYPSMRRYCVKELRLSEDAAAKRVQAARAAREYPAIFEELASGRIHLTGVNLLAPHLTSGNADDLLAAAAFKSKAEIAMLIAERFPSSEMLPLVEVLPAGVQEHAPAHAAAHLGTAEHAPVQS